MPPIKPNADPEVITAPSDELIIEIPASEMAGGFDSDGLPKTIPVEPEKPVARAKPVADPEVKSLRQRLEEADRERQRLASEAATERAAREKAESTALQDRTHAWRAHWARLGSDRDVILTGIDAATNAQTMAERELAAAKEAGDVARETAAIKTLTLATQRLDEYQRGKAGIDAEIRKTQEPYEGFEASLKSKPAEPEKKPDPKQPTADDFIASAPRNTQDWLKEHREFATPNSKDHRRLNIFAAKWLVDHDDDSQTLNSHEFLEALDKEFFPDATEHEEAHVSEAEPEPEVVEAPAAKPAAKPKSKGVAAAPVARGAYFSSSNLQAAKINLEPKLRAQLVAMGLDPVSWGLQAREDIKAGKLPKEYLDPGYDRGF